MKNNVLCVLVFCLVLGTQNLYAQSAWWRYTKLPSGGVINEIASDDAGTVYALSGQNSDVFYTTDNALNWQKIPGTQPFWNATTIAVDKPSHRLYVGTYDNGVYWTDDKGITWQSEFFFTDPISGFHAHIAAVGVKNDNTAITCFHQQIGSPGTVYVSTDGGLTWASAVAPVDSVNKFSYLSSGHLLSATDNGIFSSTDDGLSWTQIGLPGKFATSVVERISNGHLFACAHHNSPWGDTTGCGVYRSTDGGLTWAVSNTGISDTRITAIEVDPTGNLYVTTPGGIYKSTNDGITWTAVNSGLETLNMTCITSTSAGVFPGSLKSGVAYSPYPVTGWTMRNHNLCPVTFSDMTMSPTGNIHVMDQNLSGVYSLPAGAGNWTHQINGLPDGYGQYIVDAHHTLYTTNLSRPWRGIYKSFDSGVTWTDISPAPVTSTFYIKFTPLKVDSAHNRLYVLADYKTTASVSPFLVQALLSSADDGLTWATNLSVYDTATLRLDDINVTSAGDLFVSTHDFLSGAFTLLQSTDFGTTFSPVAFNFPVFFAPYGQYVTTDRNDSLYFINGTQIFRRNGINNWDSLHAGGWTNSPLYVAFDNANKIFVGTNYEGAFYSADDSTFAPLSTGLPIYADIWGAHYPIGVLGFCFDAANVPYALCMPAAVTYNNLADTLQGIYKFSTPPPLQIGSNTISKAPVIIAYPNPFNNQLNVSFTLEEPGIASIELYDMSGRCIRNMQKVKCTARTNVCSFDLTEVPPGVYNIEVITTHEKYVTKLLKK